MLSVMNDMLAVFQDSKEAGSYVLFYMLALGLGVAVAAERYGKKESGDNWMMEEAKSQIQLWPFLFSLLAFLLVAANPLTMFILGRLFPIGGQYERMWGLILLPFIIVYGVTCFHSILSEKKQKVILVFGFAILIGLSGSCYGLMSDRQSEAAIEEELEVLSWIDGYQESPTLLAADGLLAYVGDYYPEIRLLYGKDLYTANMDLGIMDAYPDELMDLYEAMKNPAQCMEDIMNMAALYDCDVVAITASDRVLREYGSYHLAKTTESYMIYVRS